MITYHEDAKKRAIKHQIPLVKIEIDRRHMGGGRIQMAGSCESLLAENLSNLMNRIIAHKEPRPSRPNRKKVKK